MLAYFLHTYLKYYLSKYVNNRDTYISYICISIEQAPLRNGIRFLG